MQNGHRHGLKFKSKAINEKCRRNEPDNGPETGTPNLTKSNMQDKQKEQCVSPTDAARQVFSCYNVVCAANFPKGIINDTIVKHT